MCIQLIHNKTLKDILKYENPDYLHRGEKLQDLGKPVFVKFLNERTFHFQLASAEHDKNGVTYDIYVMVPDLKKKALSRGMFVDEVAARTLQDDDITVSCTCPSWLYWSWKYKASKEGYNYGFKERRPPKKNNVGLVNDVCKHISVVLRYMFDNKQWVESVITTTLKRNKDFLKELERVIELDIAPDAEVVDDAVSDVE